MTSTLKGLTWDHPRGVNALVAATKADAHVDIDWQAQPLEGFESADITELAEQYDLIVLDHPHLGDALRDDSLQPFEDILDPATLREIRANVVGPSYNSYVAHGRTWSLPLDAATQVAAVRADRVPEPVQTWADVAELAESEPVALSLAGPHAYLSFASLCVSLGAEPESVPGRPHIDPVIAEYALQILRSLAAKAPADTTELNPIGLLERMSRVGDITYIPLVFGYVNYSSPNMPHPVNFIDAPAMSVGGRRGSTIGGTGIAVTQRCQVTPALAEHLAWLLSDEAQRDFIPAHDGQPALRSAWTDAEVNRASRDFYTGTLATIEDSWIRPRFEGATAFQGRASAVLRAAITGSVPIHQAISSMNQNFAETSAAQNTSPKETL